MTATNEFKGYGLALAGQFSGVLGTLMSQLLINASSAETTSVLWFLVSSVFTFIVLLVSRGGIDVKHIKKNARVYLEISLVMTVAALSWFISLELAGPSIVALVGQLGIVIGVVMGAVVLHEKISLLDGLGGLVSVVGALIITYRSGRAVEIGVLLMLVNGIGGALQSLLVKRHLAEIDKLELIFVRSVVAFLGILVFASLYGGLVWPREWMLPGLFVGSTLGFVLFNLLLYHALAYLDMAKVSILAVIAPPGIMVGAYFVFGSVPTVLQLIGGGLILVGVTLILLQPLLARRHPAKV